MRFGVSHPDPRRSRPCACSSARRPSVLARILRRRRGGDQSGSQPPDNSWRAGYCPPRRHVIVRLARRLSGCGRRRSAHIHRGGHRFGVRAGPGRGSLTVRQRLSRLMAPGWRWLRRHRRRLRHSQLLRQRIGGWTGRRIRRELQQRPPEIDVEGLCLRHRPATIDHRQPMIRRATPLGEGQPVSGRIAGRSCGGGRLCIGERVAARIPRKPRFSARRAPQQYPTQRAKPARKQPSNGHSHTPLSRCPSLRHG